MLNHTNMREESERLLPPNYEVENEDCTTTADHSPDFVWILLNATACHDCMCGDFVWWIAIGYQCWFAFRHDHNRAPHVST